MPVEGGHRVGIGKARPHGGYVAQPQDRSAAVGNKRDRRELGRPPAPLGEADEDITSPRLDFAAADIEGSAAD